MKVVVQRVSQAKLAIDQKPSCAIANGMVILLGIESADETEDISWLVRKIVNLRIFDDEQGVMNRSLLETGGEAMIVSQFTLHARVKKGNRPSYVDAAPPEIAVPLYKEFIDAFSAALGKSVATGKFGVDMAIDLTNQGPVTIIIDTKNKR